MFATEIGIKDSIKDSQHLGRNMIMLPVGVPGY